MSILDTVKPAVGREEKPNHPSSLTPSPLIVDTNAVAHPGAPPISPLLYSSFIEHLGRCIYGGIVDDPKHPSPKELLESQKSPHEDNGRLGWRKDVIKEIGGEGELECPMVRWPGGNFVSNYHWKDAIGPKSARRVRKELAWESIEINQFGTDEYIDWCRGAEVEPYICLNMGTGTLEEALDWVEYCNGTQGTYWANKRRENTGRDEPHAVKVWGLGNEMWGDWQVGHLSASDYAKKARKWAHALKLADPSIKLVLCGHEGGTKWDREVLYGCIDIVDWHSIHFYASHNAPLMSSVIGHENNKEAEGFDYEINVFGPAAAERNITICKSLIDMINSDRLRDGQKENDVKICFDEWNVWDPLIAHPTQGNEQHYDYTDMLGFCAWLNLLVRKSKDCPVACLAQAVNVIAPIITKPDGILYLTTYYPLRLFAQHMKNGHVLNLAPTADYYDGPTHPTWIQHLHLRPTYIDTCAIKVDSGVRLSILNRHPTADWHTSLRFEGIVHVMYSDDLKAKNSWEEPQRVVPKVTKFDAKEWTHASTDVIIKKHSWVFLIVRA